MGVSVMQVHHSSCVGTSFLFIGGIKLTNIGFMFIRVIKPTYVGFILESTRKGHLILGAVTFSIWHGHIFHSQFFSIGKPLSLGKLVQRSQAFDG